MIPFLMDFHTCSWDIFEVSHGKGAADGVGSLLKRTADKHVCNGNDLDSFKKLFDFLKLTCPNVLLFQESDLQNYLFTLFKDLNIIKLKTVPMITKCHSVISKVNLTNIKWPSLKKYHLIK